MKSSRQIAIAGLIGLVLAYVAWAAGTPPSTDHDERDAIALKTQIERDQLKRRYKEFQNLSAEDQADVLKIHKLIEVNPDLARTLEQYTAFIAGLDPWERERLESETDPEKRLAEVHRLLDAKNGRRNDARHPGWMTGETVRGTTFRPDDFQSMLKRLIAMLDIPPSAFPSAESGSVEWQHWAVKRLAAKWRSEDFKSWPSPAATIEMLENIPDERFREFLLRHDRVDDHERRRFLAAVLARTLMAEWQREIPERVSKEEMREVLASFKDRQRPDWMWRNPDRLQAAVIEALEKKPGSVGAFAKEYGEVHELYREFDFYADGRRRGDRHRRHENHDDKDRRDGDRNDREWRADQEH